MDTPAEPTSAPVEIPLPNYLAVQLQRSEHPAFAVEALCTTAKMMKALFRRVETLDIIQVGMQPFLRMRTDLDRERLVLVLRKILEVTGRGVVYLEGGTYRAQLSGKLAGKVLPMSSATMHMVPRGPQALYKGPKIKRWEKQFQS